MKAVSCAIIFSMLLFSCTEKSTIVFNEVQTAGAMRNVMHAGDLSDHIQLDTVPSEGLHGIGPLTNLTGEIVVNNGKVYASQVSSDSTMTVQEIPNAAAPFFVYEHVKKWGRVSKPVNIQSLKHLEKLLDEMAIKMDQQVFAFKLEGTVPSATIHVQNLPAGTEIHSMEDAHTGQKSYALKNTEATLIGFYSTQHKGVFTHHDANIHVHLLSQDHKWLGHVDEITLGDLELFIPQS
ncbi:acetolactate decarboxylase [Pustulibacterium marinum]|uniref:Alpha-acetolactate decarboxylase n=1 Tax=Pustulibacterium marinum TaxID=1224947 RepID=A0A1I7GVL6_9FLAO|nr:acetolactate decarboxylase [Pustulibacterium marinum]SFU52461.1 acetolactate decarboxylase [Pustulibacterium marinum]